MMESKSIVIGYDLGHEATQISVSRGMEEPESVSITPANGHYLVPTVLCVRNDTKDWLFGEEAVRCANRGAGVFVDDLVGKVRRGEEVVIYDTRFTAQALLERFIRKTFTALRQRYLQDNIQKIVVTTREEDMQVERAVLAALEAIGIKQDRVQFQPYIISFMYYSVCQKKELWTNDVALFDFNENGLFYHQLSTSRKYAPITVSSQTADLSDLMDAGMLETMPDNQLSYCFRTVTDKVIHRQILSTIYVTGKGFEGNWSDDVLKSLCTGRRVFKGQNLYAKGAAYRALYGNSEQLQDFLFLTDDMIRSTISIRMFKDNRIADYPMVRAGAKWSEVNAKTVGILDDTDEVFFTVFHAVKKETKHVVMSLRNLHRRENKTTRVSIAVTCIDRDTAVLTVKDLGFGQFYPNTYRVWEKVISI